MRDDLWEFAFARHRGAAFVVYWNIPSTRGGWVNAPAVFSMN